MRGNILSAPVVHVVEDDDSFRNSLLRMLAVHDVAAVGYRCAGEFLLADGLHQPGCVLLDISMPGPSGIDVLKALHAKRAIPPVIFLTGCDDIDTSVDAMKAGAVDYLVKPADCDKLLHAIEKALAIDAERRASHKEIVDLRKRFDQLNTMERRILAGIMNNRLNKQLAAELGSCERTIKAQRARIRSKLRIRSLPDLVRASMLLEQCIDEEELDDYPVLRAPEKKDRERPAYQSIGYRPQHGSV
jgi:FixJ family two-component response regulator